MDKFTNVVMDIESLAQPSDSPKMTKALSRKGPSRIERRNGEELEVEEPSRKLAVKVANLQMELLKQTLISSKPLVSVITTSTNASSPTDATNARNKRFNRLGAIHPKKILFIIATMSCIGTLILIYCTLTISSRGGA